MEQRTLRLSADAPSFEYQYWVCTEWRWPSFLGCKHTEMKKEVFDLTKPEVRKQLIDMGFVARVREKP